MKQEAFEARYSTVWHSMENWLDSAESRTNRKRNQSWKEQASQFPEHYRQLCHHLSLARARGYSPMLEERLNRLALRGHRQLYQPRVRLLHGFLGFFAHGFPAATRAHWRFMLISAAFFYGPLAIMTAALNVEPSLVHSTLDSATIEQIESMYATDAERFGIERGSAGDFAMFGMYIYNNTTIGLRTIAGGVLGGIGTLFFLLFNGYYIGAVAGHLTQAGLGVNFWPFVIGHGALELTAIVISGGAGLRLGYAMWAPGRQRRGDALALAARSVLPLVLGAALMFVCAAVIEAFWSSTVWLPATSKYLAGALLWLLVILYFGFMGRAK